MRVLLICSFSCCSITLMSTFTRARKMKSLCIMSRSFCGINSESNSKSFKANSNFEMYEYKNGNTTTHIYSANNKTMAAGVFDETQIGLIYLFWGTQCSININKYIIQICTWMLVKHAHACTHTSIVRCGCFIAAFLVHELERFFTYAHIHSDIKGGIAVILRLYFIHSNSHTYIRIHLCTITSTHIFTIDAHDVEHHGEKKEEGWKREREWVRAWNECVVAIFNATSDFVIASIFVRYRY